MPAYTICESDRAARVCGSGKKKDGNKKENFGLQSQRWCGTLISKPQRQAELPCKLAQYYWPFFFFDSESAPIPSWSHYAKHVHVSIGWCFFLHTECATRPCRNARALTLPSFIFQHSTFGCISLLRACSATCNNRSGNLPFLC